jgi:hypothetical protein
VRLTIRFPGERWEAIEMGGHRDGEVRGEREDLHARIPTGDYEYLALEIGESVGMESHTKKQYVR